MRFKRPLVRYAESPQPATPYQSAAQVWDDRLGSARVQAKNWRLMAFGCLLLALLMAGGLVWRSMQSTIVPYVVEIDSLGNTRAVGKATEPYNPKEADIVVHLERFIKLVRSLSLDPVVVRENWFEAYNYATDRGALVLNEYARQNRPFSRVGKESVSVEVYSVVRASDMTFNIRWIERHYANGALSSTQRWSAVITLVHKAPKKEDELRKNALSLYVHGLSWSRDLIVSEGVQP